MAVEFVELPDDILDKMLQVEKNTIVKATLKKDKYPKIMSQDLKTVASTTILFTHKDTPDDVVYQMAKAI